jgi:hypothetical protein
MSASMNCTLEITTPLFRRIFATLSQYSIAILTSSGSLVDNLEVTFITNAAMSRVVRRRRGTLTPAFVIHAFSLNT